MNKLKSLKGNDYVLLLSAGASLGTLFLWGASYIFPEGEIVEGCLLYTSDAADDL